MQLVWNFLINRKHNTVLEKDTKSTEYSHLLLCVCACVHAHVYAHIHLYVCGWTLISGFWGLEKKSHEKKSTDHTLLKVLCFSHQDWVSPQIGLCCCLVLSAVTGKEEVEIILEECRLHFPIFEYAS